MTDAHAQAPGIIGQIEIDIVDVYSDGEVEEAHHILRYVRRGMNTVHSDTRHFIIRRELLFDVGDPISESAFRETERNLRALGFLTNVVVGETGRLADGRSIIRVQVQETWSLMAQLSYARSSGNTRWNLQMADSNFLGYGVKFIAGLGENEDRSYSIFHFQNRRIMGTPLRLGITRVNQSDGHSNLFNLDKPFYTQDTVWGLQLKTWDRVSDTRFYLDPYEIFGARMDHALYAKLPVEEIGLSFLLTRLITEPGEGPIFRFGLGAVIKEYNPSLDPQLTLSDGRVIGAAALESLENNALRRTDDLSLRPMMFFELLGRNWVAARNILSIGPVEDLLLDPWLRIHVGPNIMKTGEGAGQFIVEGFLQDWSRVGSGYLWLRANGEAAYGNRKYTYDFLNLLGGYFRPSGERRTTRLFVEAGRGTNVLGSEAYVLGLFRGLRTLDYDGQAGDRLLRWNAEHMLRLPGELLGLYNTGLAVHYSGGVSWWRGDGTRIEDAHHEAGLGLRFGPSRSSRTELTRLDLTWPLDGSSGPKITATTSGRF